MKVYFINWYIHNSDNDGWAYKVENKYTDKDVAIKAFHGICNQYINADPYDCVTVTLTDALGNNVLPKVNWIKEDPAPEPNE